MSKLSEKSDFKKFLYKYILSEPSNNVKEQTTKERIWEIMQLWQCWTWYCILNLSYSEADALLLNCYHIGFFVFIISLFIDKARINKISAWSKFVMVYLFFWGTFLYIKYYDEIGVHLANRTR